MNIPRVVNMKSVNGKEVPNQFKILMEDGVYFQSYKTLIAFKSYDGDRIILDRDAWDYSKTTSAYLNRFLNETKKEAQTKIKSGEYHLADLNS